MEYLPLTLLIGALIGAFIGAQITRAYWRDKFAEYETVIKELQTMFNDPPQDTRACELCRYGIENRDAGPAVWICLHRLARLHGGKHRPPCVTARTQGSRCGPDAALWESRAEAIARLQEPAPDRHAWQGDGPAPVWWYAKDGTKIQRDGKGGA